ncbi:hypothetical protein VPH35_047715 [Triticum aestivum]
MQPRPAQDALFWLLLPAQRRPAALNPTANGAARGRPERILAGYPAPPPGTVFRNSIPSGAHSSGPRPQDRVGRSAEPVNPQSSGLRLSTSSRPCVNRAPEQGQDSAWTPFILCTSSFWLPTFSRSPPDIHRRLPLFAVAVQLLVPRLSGSLFHVTAGRSFSASWLMMALAVYRVSCG